VKRKPRVDGDGRATYHASQSADGETGDESAASGMRGEGGGTATKEPFEETCRLGGMKQDIRFAVRQTNMTRKMRGIVRLGQSASACQGIGRHRTVQDIASRGIHGEEPPFVILGKSVDQLTAQRPQAPPVTQRRRRRTTPVNSGGAVSR